MQVHHKQQRWRNKVNIYRHLVLTMLNCCLAVKAFILPRKNAEVSLLFRNSPVTQEVCEVAAAWVCSRLYQESAGWCVCKFGHSHFSTEGRGRTVIHGGLEAVKPQQMEIYLDAETVISSRQICSVTVTASRQLASREQNISLIIYCI